MRRVLTALLLLATLAHPSAQPGRPAGAPSLGLFDEMIRLEEDDWRDLREGKTVVRTMSVERDRQLAVVMVGPTTVTPDRFVAGVKESARLWRGPLVDRSGTFMQPAAPANVEELVLPDGDVEDIASCRPGDCEVKLGAAEIERLREVAAREGGSRHERIQREFRAVLIDRLHAYRRGGLSALPPMHDSDRPVHAETVFAELLAAVPVLRRHAPSVAEYVTRYPHAPLPPGTDQVTYWLETRETPKPTVQGLHAVLQRRPGDPVEVLVVTRQVFATHYVNGSLSVSGLVRDPRTPPVRYLVYVNRTAVDGLAGFLSGLRRFFIERRIRRAARAAFEHMRGALERG